MSGSSSERLVSVLLEIYGRTGHFALGSYDGTSVSYRPVDRPMTAADIERHLAGEIVLGSYCLATDDTVTYIAWDIDSADRTLARATCLKITAALDQIPFTVEFSGGKGYHVNVYLATPMDAATARSIGKAVVKRAGITRADASVEVFPKQESLSEDAPYGSLLKIPLGLHPKTKARSVFIPLSSTGPGGGWEDGEAAENLECLRRQAEPDSLLYLLEAGTAPRMDDLVGLLASHWYPGQHHNLALGLSGLLAEARWPQAEAEALIRKVCERAGDKDLPNRLGALADTYQKYENGTPVGGYSLLEPLIPKEALDQIVKMVRGTAAPNSLSQADAIRLAKAPAFLKVRSLLDLALATLGKEGRFFAEAGGPGRCYWLREEDHLLHECNTESGPFTALLLDRFGLNPAEPFSRQVEKALSEKIAQIAHRVPLRRRSFLEKMENGLYRLLLNYGGPDVFTLNGGEITREKNGECGQLFIYPDMRTLYSPPPDLLGPALADPMDPWSILTDGVSFAPPGDANRELLKAWTLSVFFGSIIPVHPILALFGPPATGKTTTLRLLVRLLDDPKGDVLEFFADKPDAFRTSAFHHLLLAYDNLDTKEARWLTDALNRLATGAQSELRQLYTTSGLASFQADVWAALTSVDLPFEESTFFTRLLPIELAKLARFGSEHAIQKRVTEDYYNIQAGFVHRLNATMRHWNNGHSPNGQTERAGSRLGDWETMVSCLPAESGIIPEILAQGLESLVPKQRELLAERSPIHEAIEAWLRGSMTLLGLEDPAIPRSAGELNGILKRVADENGVRWKWKSGHGLGRNIKSMREELTAQYGLEIETRWDPARARHEDTFCFGHGPDHNLKAQP
jgi:ABC-type oligopeptide transport system ATPase subunit